jgi:hypothetical protein
LPLHVGSARRGARGKLPEPQLVRLPTVVAGPDGADPVSGPVCEYANDGRTVGGAVFMASLPFATPFPNPADVAQESGLDARPPRTNPRSATPG